MKPAGWLISLPALVAVAHCETYPPGPQVLTYLSAFDHTQQPYALYLPKNFDPAKKYPLVVSLHTEGSTHRFSLQQLFSRENLEGRRYPESNRFFPPFPDVPVIAAAPLCRGTLGYQGIAEDEVHEMLADVKARFPIDDDRVYLTGASMGGGGVLWLALTQPDQWAAIAPICPLAPPQTEALAPNAFDLPVHLFQGEKDTVVAAEISRRWREELQRAGAPVEYTEIPGAGHAASWTRAYKDEEVFHWFAKFRRNRFPAHVRFVTARYRYSKAYWVIIDAFDSETPARIDASFGGVNRITVTTSHLLGFTLNLSGHPSYAAGRPLSISIDGQNITRLKGPAISFSRTAQRWKPVHYAIPAGQKRAGAEGPIAEVFAGRQIYVYGTGGSPSMDELFARRDTARKAADWSNAREPAPLSFGVVSDRELREPDAAGANLILFGTRETNAWIARLADQLPAALNPSAADYGLVFVCAAGGRTVLINSGLPWWTGAEWAKQPGLQFLPLPYRAAVNFPDYVLFKGSLENVIAQGVFTPDWKIPRTDWAKMKQTGAVETK